MKYIALVQLLLLSVYAHAQDYTTDDLRGVWAVKRISYQDNRPALSDDEVQRDNVVFVFSGRQLQFYVGGQPTKVAYTINRDLIRTAQGTAYRIGKLTDFELQLDEIASGVPAYNLFRFICSKQQAVTYEDFLREKYLLPSLRFGPDSFFVMNEYLYPKFGPLAADDDSFQEVYRRSYQAIEANFRAIALPTHDRFRVSFMVGKTGKVSDIQVIESSDPSLNEALQRAISQTQSQWAAARLDGRPVRTQVNYEFPFGLPEGQSLTLQQVQQLKARDLYEQGMKQFNRSRFPEALTLFNRAVGFDPGNISLRYNRAATNFQLKNAAAACEDWQVLEKAGEKEASRLARKHCRTATAVGAAGNQ